MPSRRAILLLPTILGASRIGRAQVSRPTEAPYHPPGFRLGIVKPDDLAARTGDPTNLLSSDQRLQVMLAEPPRFGDGLDARIWDQALERGRIRLLWERSGPPDEDRRLFERTDFDPGTGYGWRTLVIRKPGWFGQVDLSAQPLGEAGAWMRCQPLIERIADTALVRAPLSVDEVLAENRMSMDVAAFNPRHFGSKILMSLRPPKDPREAWASACYMAMEDPPRHLPYPWSRDPTKADRDAVVLPEIRSMLATTAFGPYRRWRSHGIDWIAEHPHRLTDTMVVRTLKGFAATRSIELRAYCRTDDPGVLSIMGALDRVARSVILKD